MLNAGVPDGKMEFRFFTPTKCDGTQNNENHMNRKLANIFARQKSRIFAAKEIIIGKKLHER